jgi:hypothetical protein
MKITAWGECLGPIVDPQNGVADCPDGREIHPEGCIACREIGLEMEEDR